MIICVLKLAAHFFCVGYGVIHVDKQTVLVTGAVDPLRDPVVIAAGIGALYSVNVIPAGGG